MDSRISSYRCFELRDGEHCFPVYTKAPANAASPAPAVVVMHEVPGIYSAVIDFAERLVREGYTVYMPSLTGTPGRDFSAAYVLSSISRACISKEFHVLARGHSSPITDALRALCRRAHAECGGVGVGAIGMCLTGNFALSLMVDESVMAPVLSQPSLPFPVSGSHKRALHVSDDEWVCIKRRVGEGVSILGLRFTEDPMCPPERFDRLRSELGDGFEAIEIDSSSGNAFNVARSAHSVVTRDLVDEAGHPTQAALHRLLEFFAQRLKSESPVTAPRGA